MKSIVLKYGLGCGLLIILYSTVTFIFFGDFSKLSPEQFKAFESLGFLRYLLLLITIYLAMRRFKKAPDRPVSFRSLMKTGVQVAFLVAVMVGLMELVYILQHPDFFEKYGAIMLQQMKASGTSDEEIKKTTEAMEQYKFMQTPWANGLFYFFETAFIGNIATLAFAFVMKPREVAGNAL